MTAIIFYHIQRIFRHEVSFNCSIHIAATLLLECPKIRGHYEAMLIHVHRSTTLSNDRKTEKRPDLGAAPPSGPIKEGYPCTNWARTH